MNVVSRLTVVLAAGAVLTTGFITASQAQSIADVEASTKVAADWADGKLANYGSAKVTYTGEPIVLRLSSHLPPVSGLAKSMMKSLPILERMSNGKLKIEARFGGTVHSVTEGLDALRSGITDITACFTFLAPTNFPMTTMLSLPGKFPNAAVQTAVAERLAPKYFVPEFDRQQVAIFGITGSPEVDLFSRKPIRTLQDLGGLKVRSGGGINEAVFRALGAATVNMGSRDFYSALQRGLIDAIFTNDAAGKIFRLHEVATHFIEVDLTRTPLEYCLNKKTFQALPGDLQVVYNNWARAMTMSQAQAVYVRDGVRAREDFRKAGLNFYTLPADEHRGWIDRAKVAVEAYLAEQEKAGRPARKIVAEMDALIAQYSKQSLAELMTDAIDNPFQGLAPYKR